MKGNFFLIASLGIIFALVAWAAPNTIRFQGRLTDNGGNPIAGPDVRVRFSLYPTASGGASVWDGPASQTVASNEAGLFATDIGPFPQNLLANNPELYLQVSVYDGTSFKTLAPRQKLSSVPYAIQAESVPDQSVTPAKIQNKSLTENQLVDHAIGTTTLTSSVVNSLIPSGMVAMFAKACPNGWVPFEELTNRFPYGVENSVDVSTGGSSEITGLTTVSSGTHRHIADPHSHGIPLASINHKHQTPLLLRTVDNAALGSANSPFGSSGNFGQNIWIPGFSAGQDAKADYPYQLTNTIDPDTYSGGMTSSSTPANLGTSTTPDHNHKVVSDGNWLPPFYGLIFCIKN